MTNERTEELLDRIADEIRREPETLDSAVERETLARAWDRIAREGGVETGSDSRVLDCEEIQRLLPAYRSGDLKKERELLIQDHLRSCVPCRRMLRELEEGPAEVAEAPGAGRRERPIVRWAAAAAVLLALAVVPFLLLRQGAPGDEALRLAEGSLFVLEGDRAELAAPGDALRWNTELRTPRGEGATVTLSDGTRIEMRERSRLSFGQSRGGTTLELRGGDVIVEAAKQRDGRHLFVSTDDCLISVIGTVFAVNDGTKGSRVSVFEGEVKVEQSGRDHVLRAGDQVTTSERVSRVALDEEISWSGNRERHLALVREIAALDRELAALPRPQARYGSALLEAMPADTMIFATFPNLADTWQTGLARLTQRVASEPVLSDWVAGGELDEVRDLLVRILELGDDLGEELVIAGWLDAEEDVVGPVLVADALAPHALIAALDQELAATGEASIRRVDDPFDPALPEDDVILLYVSDRHLVAAPGAAALAGAAASLAGGTPTFHGDALYQRIADRYRDGVESLVAIDLGSLIRNENSLEGQRRLDALGISDTEHLILEQWGEGEATRRQAVVSFSDTRRGVAAWLAAPASMGSLSFVSPEATSAFAVVFRRPEELFTDVMASFTDEERSEIERELAEMQAEHGWNVEEDLFRPLGGEMAFALDGPLAPTPAWKMVVEVYDPNLLQAGIERLVTDLSSRMAAEGEGSLELAAEGDLWTVERIRADGKSSRIVYGYFDGYLVAGPSAGLVDRARRYRASGVNLLTSSRMRDLLPSGAETNFSALWFNDLSNVTEPLAGLFDGFGSSMEMDEETRQALEQIQEGMGPSLAWAYGNDDQILVGSNSPRSPLSWLAWLAAHGASGG